MCVCVCVCALVRGTGLDPTVSNADLKHMQSKFC